MDVYNTHGAFSWSELLTTDVEGARSFYTALFGWTVKTMDMPNSPYSTCQVGESAVGGMMKIPPMASGMAPQWGCYVTVKSVEETLAQVISLGGKVIAAPMDIPNVGRMAVIQDPQGASLSIIKYAMPVG
jgi:uncharacterized protein